MHGEVMSDGSLTNFQFEMTPDRECCFYNNHPKKKKATTTDDDN